MVIIEVVAMAEVAMNSLEVVNFIIAIIKLVIINSLLFHRPSPILLRDRKLHVKSMVKMVILLWIATIA